MEIMQTKFLNPADDPYSRWENKEPYQHFPEPEKTFSGKASGGKEFIYLLLFNIDEATPHLPFHVGTAKEFNQRFASHSQLKWHLKTFHRPAKLFIAGTVYLDMVEQAKNDMILRLASAGFHLNNTVPRKENISFMTISPEETYNYLGRPFNLDLPLHSWKAHWERLMRPSSSEKPQPVATLPLLPKEVLGYMANRKYGMNTAALLSQKLAGKYDSETGTATHMFSATPNRIAKGELGRITAQVKALKGDWKVKGTLRLNEPVTFELSTPIREAIVSKRSR